MPECEGAGFKCAVCRQAHIHTRTPTVRWWCCSSVAVCDRARRQTGIERSWTHTIPASLPWQLRPQPGPDRWAEQRTEPKECVCPLTRCSKVISRGHWRRRCCCQVYTQNWPSVAHTEVLTWMNKWMKWGRTPAVGDAQTFFSSYRIGRNGEGNIVEPSPHRETHSSDLAFVEHFWFFCMRVQRISSDPEAVRQAGGIKYPGDSLYTNRWVKRFFFSFTFGAVKMSLWTPHECHMGCRADSSHCLHRRTDVCGENQVKKDSFILGCRPRSGLRSLPASVVNYSLA